MTKRLSNSDIAETIQRIKEKIAEAALRSGRKFEDIILLAATKTVPAHVINQTIKCGIKYIGENRVQEYLKKRDELELDNCRVHFIGHLQTNKVRQIVGKVDMIQSVDSVKLAHEIGKQSRKIGITTDILVEVNIGKESSKYGFYPDQLEQALYEISQIDGIKVKGLMTIPPICDKKEQSREFFFNMSKLFIDIKSKKLDNISMEILSMGMSGDYQEAILEGSNLVRLGSVIFGERKY